ncbi:MAG: ATP-binding domain-containing protein, partial [Muribaculaceae bacterium]|nr:ATP-binding domain-containing protein [Muribaculaceae bacterium]
MLRSLVAEGPSIPREEMEHLYNRVMDSYEGSLSEKIKGTASDPFYNALQVKYAYCVTCHKAQGGQWRNVFVDMGYIPPEAYTSKELYRWLYTSLTRATDRVYLINPSIKVK